MKHNRRRTRQKKKMHITYRRLHKMFTKKQNSIWINSEMEAF